MKNNFGRLSIVALLAGLSQAVWSEPEGATAPAAVAAPSPEAAPAKPAKKPMRQSTRKSAASKAASPAVTPAVDPATAPAATPAVVSAPALVAAAAAVVSPAEPAAAPAAAPVAASVAAQVAAPVAETARRPGAAPTAAGLTQRWEALGNLLERSSAAKHIEHEGSPESKELQQQARAARAKAKQAIDAGELEKADVLLREASQLMFKSERASRSPAIAADKAKGDFVARRNSVQALLQTGRRIAGEEHKTKPEFTQAEGLIKEADNLADAGKHADGRVKLDQAYALITGAVRGMREGTTIRADKNFATKAEEYKYEQARNEDYRGLIAGIVEGKDSSWTDVANESIKLRDEADRLAGSNDHEAALKKINESTSKLKALLRRSGFPIL